MTRHSSPITDDGQPIGLDNSWLSELLGRLDLERKVLLLTGRDHWHTQPLPEIGLRAMRMSDGPVGVRGEVWDERRPASNLPSTTVLAATWDPSLARDYGRVLAAEARDRNVDVLLAPTVNLHRSPLGGRHFEAFSEDPLLTALVAAGFVAGVQDGGVGAAVKHYVANEYETERFTASSEVSERALRELYLLAFEEAITRAGAWLVMSSYNAVNGVTASESPLLQVPLKVEWAFDGVVVSDWSAVRSLASAASGQDLVMPGPHGPWGQPLVDAVREGRIPEAVIDDKVRRVLLLAARVGALEGAVPAPRIDDVLEAASVARHVAVEGTVLLRNEGVLPLDAARLRRVAVIGDNAARARIQGGGSATVLPPYAVSPLDGLRAALPDALVTHATGAMVRTGVDALTLDEITHAETGEPGLLVRFLAQGQELHREHRLSTDLVWFGGDAPVRASDELELRFSWTPAATRTLWLGFAAMGWGQLLLDGRSVLEGAGAVSATRLGASPLAPPSISTAVEAVAGEPREVVVRLRIDAQNLGPAGLLAIRVGLEARADAQQLIDEAVAEAAGADVAVVVVGTNSDVESEGFDRASLVLPGHQDDLVRAVVATGTPCVVVVNSGAPVLLPWRDDVAAIVAPLFGGQEMGHALADVLLGRAEPGGRLPTTWPAAEPSRSEVTPVDGRVSYREGIHIGYRGWLRDGTPPAYPFGHGLGYTTWLSSGLEMAPPEPGQDGRVVLRVRNTGARAGKYVLQVYLSREISAVDRPVRWLAGHAVVRADAGECTRVTIGLPWRAFAHWEEGDWRVEPGCYDVHVGRSVTQLPLRGEVDVTAHPPAAWAAPSEAPTRS